MHGSGPIDTNGHETGAEEAPGKTLPDPTAGYADQHRPLAGYAVLTTVFGSALVGSAVAAHARGHRIPERIRWSDIATIGIATHKLSRMISKDKSTSFIRAPFVTYEGAAGHGELSEAARGEGLRLAVGELLLCPYCLAQWVSAAFAVGLVAAPRTTRLTAAAYTAETIADFLQLAYKSAADRA